MSLRWVGNALQSVFHVRNVLRNTGKDILKKGTGRIVRECESRTLQCAACFADRGTNFGMCQQVSREAADISYDYNM